MITTVYVLAHLIGLEKSGAVIALLPSPHILLTQLNESLKSCLVGSPFSDFCNDLFGGDSIVYA